jgi:RNA polymerase sigma-70 factor (ECF subfamily)
MTVALAVRPHAPAETDEDLARRAAAGDGEAFRSLFDRHARYVLNVANRIVGNAADAEDVMQEVFLVLHRELGRWRGESKFTTWLYRVAASRAINHRKKRDTDRAREDRVAGREGAGAEEPSVDPERVRRAVASLPSEYRELAALRYTAGLSYEEIAGMLGVVVGTVKSRMFRLHQSLADALRAGETKA